MEYVAGVAFVKTVGIDGTLQCLSSVTSSAKCIYNMISSIKTFDESQEVMRFIEETDLERKIRLVESVMAGIDIKQHHTAALAYCINDLKECLALMETLLAAINTRVTYNRSIWMFKSFRAYGFSDLFDRLKISFRNLADRKTALFEVLRINDRLMEVND